MEEVLRSLQEGGSIERRGSEVGLKHPTAKVDVPDSVRDVLLGRLARLDPASRDLLRVAAVIGREFPRRVLERVIGETPQPLEDRLRTLRSAELIHNTRVWPEVVYAFKHALIHEVAYDAQDEAERRSEHARIGEAVEQAYSDRVSEHFGVLAHHFTQAQRWHKSLEYLLAAAQQAERNFASREALALYDEALRAAERLSGGGGDPWTLIKIHQAKTHLYAVTSEFERSAAEGQRILPLARLIGDRTTEADALAAIAWASFWGRNLDGAVRYSREALAVGEPAGALAAQGRAHFTLGFLRSATGVIDEGQAGLERATAISRAAGDAVHESLSLSTAGLVRNWFGDFHEADRLQAQAMTLARERDLLVPTLFGCFMRGLTLTGKGDYDGAFALLTEGMSLAERVGDEAVHHRLLNCLGWVFAELGDLDESEALNARSAVIGRRRSDPGTSPNAELNLGEVFTARGELARAQDRFDTIFRYYKDPSSSLWMRFRYSIRMFAGMGELAVAQGDFRAARAYSAECLDLAIRAAARKNLVKAWRLAGKIAHADGDRDTAEGHFRKSRDLAVSLGNPVQQWKTELALGHFLRETGRPDDARHAYERALAVMDRVREGLRHERLKDAFAKNSDYRQLHDLVAGV